MAPSVGREETVSSKPTSQPHRYYTRSSRDRKPRREYLYPSEERTHARITSQQPRKPSQLPVHQCQPPSDQPSHNESESDGQESQNETTMDQVTYSNPLRAPCPSPAMKSIQPFHPFPPTQGQANQHSDGTRQENWRQSGSLGAGQCILVEAATRAQMAILVDEIGMMEIEQT